MKIVFEILIFTLMGTHCGETSDILVAGGVGFGLHKYLNGAVLNEYYRKDLQGKTYRREALLNSKTVNNIFEIRNLETFVDRSEDKYDAFEDRLQRKVDELTNYVQTRTFDENEGNNAVIKVIKVENEKQIIM